MKIIKSLVWILTGVMFLSPMMGFAKFRYKKTFVQTYPETKETKLNNCMTCHLADEDGPEKSRNAYGLDLELWLKDHPDSAFEDALRAVEPLDSDRDNATNIQEITALTYPGDIDDVPPSDE